MADNTPFIPDYVIADMIKVFLANKDDPHTGMRKATERLFGELAKLTKKPAVKEAKFKVTEQIVVDCYAYIWAKTDVWKLSPKEITHAALVWVEDYLDGKIDPKMLVRDKRIDLMRQVFESRNMGTYTGEIENILSMMDKANAK